MRVSLQRVWIQLATDPLVRVIAGSQDRVEVDEVDARVQVYANNRHRIISTPRTVQSHTVTLINVTEADLAVLRGMKGKIVLYRDRRGRRMYGMFNSWTPVRMSKDNNHLDVALTVFKVTYTELRGWVAI